MHTSDFSAKLIFRHISNNPQRGVAMARSALTFKLILLPTILGFLLMAPAIDAASPSKAETTANPATVRGGDSKNVAGGQIAVPLSQDEIDSIAASLPEGETKQMFKEKTATGPAKDKAESDETYKKGEGLIPIFFEGEKEFSEAQEHLRFFFTESKFNSREWTAALDNLNKSKGSGHLLLTLFIVAVLILCGLVMEWLVRRATGDLRRQLLDTVSLGRLQFLGRGVSRLLLDLLGLGVFMLTTFVLYAFFYDEGDPGFQIVSSALLLCYYIRFAILTCNVVLSPARPDLRLLVLQDEDARFLYRWFIAIAVTMMVSGTISYNLRDAGISQENFLFMYSLSGFSVSLLVAVMIWRSRHRVAQAIRPGDPTEGETKSSLRARIARSWHWFAILGVLGVGVFWFIRGLAGEEGALIPIFISIFLIPIFIGLDQWIERLLKIAAGIAPVHCGPQGIDGFETMSAAGVVPSEETDDEKENRKFYLQQYLPVIKTALRILLAGLMFFLILRLWGIDLPIGRIFTSTALNIIGLALLGIVVWQYTKARIDRRLREEMPDEDEDMEEGGSGGSRIGTLLVLLRKFILSVLFVLISLIVLSSLGVNIGPLIAGAGVIGLAIGFGAQTLVKDILSGVFFLIDDAFRVGDYIEAAGTKGMVEHISLRSVKLRHARGMVFTVPFGDMGAVQNFSRDYIITKLDFRVRYGTDVDKVRKIIKRINIEFEQDEELGPTLLGKVKSQGVKALDDSAMIMRVKFKTKPGQQFVIRREVYRRIEEAFRANGIEFAHRNVTVYLPPEVTGTASEEASEDGNAPAGTADKKMIGAGAAAAIAASQQQEEEAEKEPEK
jgi:small-conductance mechanosensitive channel